MAKKKEEVEEAKPDFIVKIGAGIPLIGGKRVPYGWSSSDSGIAYVNGKGEVSGISVGEATITCEYEGEGRSWLVKVIPAPTLGKW